MKLVIFDLDGTLLNTIADLGEACNHALAHFGLPLHRADEYPHLVGNGVNKLIERALPEGCKTEENILKLREVFVPYYDAHNCVHTVPYEGIVDLLSQLKQKGYRLAVASNKYQAATEFLVNHYFKGVFDVVLGERAGCPRKPDKQIVVDIIKEIEAKTSEAVSATYYVGDSLVDVQTASNAGLPMIACSWGFCTKEELSAAQPTYLVDYPSEIANLV